MSLTAIIVDDEPLARSRLKRMLLSEGVQIVAEGCNGQEAVQLTKAYESDLLFIDINMPVQNGLSAAAEIRTSLGNPPSIIFCTAYSEFALEAFESNASGYLLKPINIEGLKKAISEAGRLNQLQVKQLSNTVEPASLTFTIGADLSKEKIKINAVSHFKSIDKHVYSAIDGRGDVLVNFSLKALEAMFEENLIRVHRSTLVNRDRIVMLNKENDGVYYLSLDKIEEVFVVSRRHISKIKRHFE